jgi:hypothetical protein
MEEASARKVAVVSAERDAAHERALELRKERRLQRAFSQAEGSTVGESRGLFFRCSRASWARSHR